MELHARTPARLPPQLRGIDRVASIMRRPILNECDERFVKPRLARPDPVERCADLSDDREIVPLAPAAADTIALTWPAMSCDGEDSAGMIFDMDPIAHIPAIAINLNGPPVDRSQNGDRDQLFWKLIGAIRIRSLSDDDGQAVSPPPGEREEIGAALLAE